MNYIDNLLNSNLKLCLINKILSIFFNKFNKMFFNEQIVFK